MDNSLEYVLPFLDKDLHIFHQYRINIKEGMVQYASNFGQLDHRSEIQSGFYPSHPGQAWRVPFPVITIFVVYYQILDNDLSPPKIDLTVR